MSSADYNEIVRGRPPRPPTPPRPEDEDELRQLRETVEVQARTIKYLLSNYDALLKKVEREENGGHGD